MKIVKETTVWDDGNTPNHTYFVNDSMTEMVAYIASGKIEKFTFKKPIKFDRRGRTFKVLKTVDTEPETIKVTGSKGSVYSLTRVDSGWSCSCPGFTYRSTCKHLALAPTG